MHSTLVVHQLYSFGQILVVCIFDVHQHILEGPIKSVVACVQTHIVDQHCLEQ